jgi:hypothetical protein
MGLEIGSIGTAMGQPESFQAVGEAMAHLATHAPEPGRRKPEAG